MDQNAFRSLLSAPRAAQSSGNGASSSRGTLGKAAPKRGWDLKPKKGHEKPKEDVPKEEPSRPAFAPRQHRRREEDNEGQSQYKDRAEMRRKGVDDEYKSVEKLLEDFEARKASATAPEELEAIEKQRAYLGGDAEHSVLVKGLDYALLAARKAELAREEGENMDDELDELARGLGGKSRGKEGKDAKDGGKEKEAALGKGFKSIAQKKAEAEAASGEKRKKKKKKKVKAELTNGAVKAESPAIAGPSTAAQLTASRDTTTPASPVKEEESRIRQPTLAPLEEPDDDEDIFGGVGEYNLNTGGDSDSEDDEKEQAERMDVDAESRRGRSRSRESHRTKEHGGLGPRSPGYRHDRSCSKSRSRDYRRSRSSSYDRRSRSRSRSPYSRKRYRVDSHFHSPPRHRRREYSPSPRRSGVREYRRSPSPRRDRYSRSRSRSPYRRYSRSPRRYSPSPRRRYSPSPRRRPSSRRYSASPHRSLSPPPAPRARSLSRSPTPLLNNPYHSPSRSLSPSSDEGQAPATRLQPLSSSAIPSLRSFLEADTEAAKADERRARKAKWRAQQGLSAQDGAQELLSSGGKDINEKQKANRDYQLLMNKINKEPGKE